MVVVVKSRGQANNHVDHMLVIARSLARHAEVREACCIHLRGAADSPDSTPLKLNYFDHSVRASERASTIAPKHHVHNQINHWFEEGREQEEAERMQPKMRSIAREIEIEIIDNLDDYTHQVEPNPSDQVE